ncbi:hypothetical protein KIL84_004440 [Mauremys mutica]|uniref:TFIIS N-terminal domain-containing protein n=1 Tax=Mauremys mutica TaxID=74926 RepID=A0A9D3XPE0_9SAUR|nr:hypothetical protein KIL84_004440 [Mauremys mutica]
MVSLVWVKIRDGVGENNTAKLVKQLSKSSEDEELRRLASILVSDWMGVIRSQSSAQPAERDKKKRKEESKGKAPVQEKPQEAKAEAKAEETPEKKREKPKSLRTTAPSHAKFRSTVAAPPVAEAGLLTTAWVEEAATVAATAEVTEAMVEATAGVTAAMVGATEAAAMVEATEAAVMAL